MMTDEDNYDILHKLFKEQIRFFRGTNTLNLMTLLSCLHFNSLCLKYK